MDTLSHGLWGSLAFGRKNKKSFLLALSFGMSPDLFSFGPFFVGAFLGLWSWPPISVEPPSPFAIPDFVHFMYRPTHSLIIFAAAFLLVWLIRRKPAWEMVAWGLHILYDIPFHEHRFFPTPFLWPVSSFTVDGWTWGNPWIFFPNAALLAAGYGLLLLFIHRRKRRLPIEVSLQ